jgi:hypothetical protein
LYVTAKEIAVHWAVNVTLPNPTGVEVVAEEVRFTVVACAPVSIQPVKAYPVRVGEVGNVKEESVRYVLSPPACEVVAPLSSYVTVFVEGDH